MLPCDNVDYQAVLADLERRKWEFETGIAALRRIAARFGPNPAIQTDEMGITSATLRFLSERPSESFSATEIAAAIGCLKLGSVRGAMYRRIKMGTLQKDRAGRVRFAAAEIKSSLPQSSPEGATALQVPPEDVQGHS